MVPLILIGVIVAVPVLLALIFRVNAVFVFMSICVGYFLQFALSDDVDLVLATVVQGSDSIVAARLILLGLPLLVTLFVLRKTVGKSLLLQITPLVFSGMFLATLALPLMPPDLEQKIYSAQYGNAIKSSQDLVIAIAAVSNLTLVWLLFQHKHTSKKHH